MATDDRLVEIMAELLAETRESKAITQRMADDTSELKNQMTKNNAGIGELRLSVMRLADKVEEIYHLDERVKVLENIVLPGPRKAA